MGDSDTKKVDFLINSLKENLNVGNQGNEKKQILVTGGAGYLGSILVPMLLESGYKVTVLDKFYFGRSSLASIEDNPDLELINVDIFYHENIPNLFKNVQTVIHLASISNDPSGDLDPNLTIQTNFLATVSLARRAKAEGAKEFIFVSSCSVYGASGTKLLDEQSSTGPVTIYALTKIQCENELLPMADENFTVTIPRGSNLVIHGDGLQYRPFLHVRDAARSIMHIMKTDSRLTNGKVFNIGNNYVNFNYIICTHV